MNKEELLNEIDYWIEQAQSDLHCFENDNGYEQSKQIFLALAQQEQLLCYIPEGRKGIMAYCIIPDFRGGLCVAELFMYIKPEYRGSVRLFKELVEHLEKVAKDNKCVAVRIASNIGYNDSKVLRCLQHFGYDLDSVVKYL